MTSIDFTIESLGSLLSSLSVQEATPLLPTVQSYVRSLSSHPRPEAIDAKVELLRVSLALENQLIRLGWETQAMAIFIHTQQPQYFNMPLLARDGQMVEIGTLLEQFGGVRALLLLNGRVPFGGPDATIFTTRIDRAIKCLRHTICNCKESSADRLRLLVQITSVRASLEKTRWADYKEHLDPCVRDLAMIVGNDGGEGQTLKKQSNVTKEPYASEPVPAPGTRPNINIMKKDKNSAMRVAKVKEEDLATPMLQQQTQIPSSWPDPGKTSSTPSSQSPLAALFAERAARLEGRERAQRLAERAELRAKAEARKIAIAADPTKAEQRKYVEEMKEKLRQDQVQKERILAQIEDDKVVRREKAERERLKRDWMEQEDRRMVERKDDEMEE